METPMVEKRVPVLARVKHVKNTHQVKKNKGTKYRGSLSWFKRRDVSIKAPGALGSAITWRG